MDQTTNEPNPQGVRRTVTVEEAAQVLGIGRALAYEEARKGSIAGVPVIRVGRRLLISRAALDRALGPTKTV